jgi:hypothetical protein
MKRLPTVARCPGSVADSGDAGVFIERMLAHLRDTPVISCLGDRRCSRPRSSAILSTITIKLNVPCAVSSYRKAEGAQRGSYCRASAIGALGAKGVGDRGGPFAGGSSAL